MAYEKYTWQCGEVITTEKLNHLEDGVANAVSGVLAIKKVSEEEVLAGAVCESGGTKYTFNRTWQEVYDAVQNGILPMLIWDAATSDNGDHTISVETLTEVYWNTTAPGYLMSFNNEGLRADSADGYLYYTKCSGGTI